MPVGDIGRPDDGFFFHFLLFIVTRAYSCSPGFANGRIPVVSVSCFLYQQVQTDICVTSAQLCYAKSFRYSTRYKLCERICVFVEFFYLIPTFL